jgi:hypothetical protein
LLKAIDSGDWVVRPTDEIDRDLSEVYGFHIQVQDKTRALTAIAQALNDGDIARAQMTALHLKLPDPPDSSTQSSNQKIWLIKSLLEAGLLKWDAAKHPRWPAGSPDSVGGRFAPAGAEQTGEATARRDVPEPRLVEAQVAVPFPGAGEAVEAPQGYPIWVRSRRLFPSRHQTRSLTILTRGVGSAWRNGDARTNTVSGCSRKRNSEEMDIEALAARITISACVVRSHKIVAATPSKFGHRSKNATAIQPRRTVGAA